MLFLLILVTMSNLSGNKNETIVLGGGCFWCTEAVFQMVQGVESVSSGYAGGTTPNPSYDEISTGETGHAEVIKVEYNPKTITSTEILQLFFEMHDPTTLNRQGADVGTQYRSVIYFTTTEQEKEAHKIIEEINKKLPSYQPVVTEVKALDKFYEAEKYHQNYYSSNKNQPYCRFVISPKIEKFNFKFKHLKK